MACARMPNQVGTEGQIDQRARQKQYTETDACDLAGRQQSIVFVVHIPSPGCAQRPTHARRFPTQPHLQ